MRLLLLVLFVACRLAAADVPIEAAEPVAVTHWNRPIIELRRGIHGLTVEERVRRIERRLATLSDATLDQPVTAKPAVVEGVRGHLLFVGPEQVMTLADDDLPTDGDPPAAVAGVVQRLQEALEARQRQHRPEVIAWGILWSVVASLLLVGVLWLEVRAQRRLRARIEVLEPRLPHVAGINPAPALRRILLTVLLLTAWTLAGVALYGWLTTVLSQFPYSQPTAHLLGDRVLGFLRFLTGTVVAALPGLGMIVLIAAITRVVARALDSFFTSVEAGTLTLAWMEPDTARATRRVAAVALWLFAITVAYPYIPGSGSDAFKGVTVFAGLLLSFGSAGMVNQMMSGLVVIYARMMKPGDMVQVGEVAGQVTNLGFLSTKVRTSAGHEVTLPNAVLTATAVHNHSRFDPAQGPQVTATVTIGYDTPWRQVHALLTAAAAKTPGVVPGVAPEVLQTALSDFYVEYRLRVRIDAVERRVQIASLLHAEILDAFNEAGVQIMSPHFMQQPTQPVLPPT
jgi:small-conductance mechanosensitive channel